MSNTEQAMAYKILTKALSQSMVPCKDGPHRWAHPKEFMLMQRQDDSWGFKHRDTRNYLFVSTKGVLRIPMTEEPFLRGYFDRFDSSW